MRLLLVIALASFLAGCANEASRSGPFQGGYGGLSGGLPQGAR